MSTLNAVQFSNASAYPIPFDRLRPGSYFRITSEPSRNIKHVRDNRIYQRAYNGFYSENISGRTGCVLLPNDLCMPLRRSKAK